MGACEGCTCGRANGVNAGDGATVPTTTGGASLPLPRTGLKSFTSPAGQLADEGIVKPKVELRSKKWFNDPNDLGTFRLPPWCPIG